jgi:hypothetical protein
MNYIVTLLGDLLHSSFINDLGVHGFNVVVDQDFVGFSWLSHESLVLYVLLVMLFLASNHRF